VIGTVVQPKKRIVCPSGENAGWPPPSNVSCRSPLPSAFAT